MSRPKPAFFLVPMLLFLFLPATFAGDLTQEINFSVDDLSVVHGQGYDFLYLPEGVPAFPVGSPALPEIQAKVALPWNAQDPEITILDVEFQELDGTFHVPPMTKPQKMIGTDPGGSPFLEDPAVYGKDAYFPGTYGKVLAQWDLVGQRMATLVFDPVQYNPVSGKIRFATHLRFRLSWTEAVPAPPRKTFNLSPEGRRDYARQLKTGTLNPEEVSIPSFSGSSSRALAPGNYEHVIIAPQAFESAWNDLVDWHTRKGLPDIVVTREYIAANYSGSSEVDKIRNFVIDAHATWGTRYFLIGADGGTGSLQVPYHSRSLLGDSIPNDTYYADYNGNWVVDVHVGRASVASTTQIGQFIDKVLTYEKNPPLTNYAKKVFFMGFDLDGSTQGEDTKEYIKNHYIPGSMTFESEYDSEPGTHLADVIAYMNDGPNLVNHNDHCNWNVWGMGYVNHNESMYASDVNGLTNGDRAMNYYTLGCLASAWQYSTSLSETFVRKVGGGGVSFTGNTMYGWYSPGHYDLYSSLYDIRWWKMLFQQNKYLVGETLSTHKNDYYPGDDYYKYIFTELNLLGEPAMPLWKDDPAALSVTYDDPIYTGSQSYQVHVEEGGAALAGALVCLWKDGEVYDHGTTNAAGDITFTIDPVTSGTMLVTVTAQDALPHEGQVTVNAGGPPVLTDVNPNDGPVAGGTACTLTGYNFTTTQDTTVTFGGAVAGNMVVVDSNTITCTAPSHSAGTVDVTVTNGNGSGTLPSAFTYHNPPAITGVSPDHGPVSGGTAVTITGTDFTSVGTTTVTFGGAAASGVTVVNATTLTCTTPAHSAGTVDVTVTSDFGSDTLGGGFTYDHPPVITDVSPDTGPMGGGTTVTITGGYFTTSANTTVLFGGTAAANVNVITSSTLTCTTPAHAVGPVDVTVTNENGSDTLPDGFTYYTAPVITSVVPDNGPIVGGTPVTIYGANFTTTPDTQVTFDGLSASNIVVVNTGIITCETPPHASGPVDVTVQNSYGSDTLQNGFTYGYPPVVYNVDPADGPVAGYTAVTVYGSNFTSTFDTTVTFGGAAATGVTVIDYGTIQCLTPPHAAGTVNVSVTTSNGTGTLENGFTYHNPPVLLAVSPDNGPMAGGTPVTLTGTDFTETSETTVTFGGQAAANLVVVNATTITCETPPSTASGTVDVTVTNPWGSDTLAGGFTYNPPPEVTGVEPDYGSMAGGDTVTVTGNYFLPAQDTQVLFDGHSASNVVVVDAGTITCTTPSYPIPDVIDVTVVNSNGSDTLAQGFEFLPESGAPPMNLTDVDTLTLHWNDWVRLAITGQPGAFYMTFLSFGGGPLNTPWGIMGLDIPIYFLWGTNLNANGYHTIPLFLKDNGLGPITFYLQAIVDDQPPVWAVGGNNPNGSGSIKWVVQ